LGNAPQNSCTAKTAEKKTEIVQGESWEKKNPASAFYHPGPVFDFEK